MQTWLLTALALAAICQGPVSKDTAAAAIAAFLHLRPEQVLVEQAERDERGFLEVLARLKGTDGEERIAAHLEASTLAVCHVLWSEYWRPGRYGNAKLDEQQAAGIARSALQRWLGKQLSVTRARLSPSGVYFVSLAELTKGGAWTGLYASVAVARDSGKIATVVIHYPSRAKPRAPRLSKEQAEALARRAAGRRWGVAADQVQVNRSALVLSAAAARGGPAWFVEVSSPGRRPLALIVDAVTGRDITPSSSP